MSQKFPALQMRGGDIHLVRDNKIVGRAIMAVGCGHDIGVRIMDGVIADELLALPGMVELGLRFSYHHFDTQSGVFRYVSGEGSDEVQELMSSVRAVTAQNLKYGLCPDSFSDVPGYRSELEDFDTTE